MRTRTTTGPWTGRALRRAMDEVGMRPYGLAKALRGEPGCGKASAQGVEKWLSPESGEDRRASDPGATYLAAISRVLIRAGVRWATMERLCSEPPEAPR